MRRRLGNGAAWEDGPSKQRPPPHSRRACLGGPELPGKSSFCKGRAGVGAGSSAGEAGGAEAEWKRMLSQKPDFSTHSISSPSVP